MVLGDDNPAVNIRDLLGRNIDEEKLLEEEEKSKEEQNVKLRDEILHDRKNYTTRLVAVWIFQVSFSMLILNWAWRSSTHIGIR